MVEFYKANVYMMVVVKEFIRFITRISNFLVSISSTIYLSVKLIFSNRKTFNKKEVNFDR